MDVDTREIVGVYIGDAFGTLRSAIASEKAARKLWESLPPIYRQCAVAYTDFWSAYGAVFPKKRHQAVGKAKQRGNHGVSPLGVPRPERRCTTLRVESRCAAIVSSRNR